MFRASATDIVLAAITDLGFLAAAFVVARLHFPAGGRCPNGGWRTRTSQSTGSSPGAWLDRHDGRAVPDRAADRQRRRRCCVSTGSEVYGGAATTVVVRTADRRVTTVPVSRIQTIVIRQSVLRRSSACARLAWIEPSTSGEDNGESLAVANILPVIGTPHVVGVLRAMLPEWDCTSPTFTDRPGLARYYLACPWPSAPWPLAARRRVRAVAEDVRDRHIVLVAGGSAHCVRVLVDEPLVRVAHRGFALPDGDRPEGTTRETGSIDDAGADAGRRAFRHAMRTAGHASPWPHRIAATGVRGVSCFTVFTRRSHVQSFRRSTTAWRAPLGIERVVMPLFVMNGLSELRFRLFGEDADRLACWAEQ
ncbi:MAG: hypothetical protein ACLT4Y_11395 [Bifidobacterium breve]